MSLQLIAKQMEAKGRGGDSMLVHMTPDEVAGLQKLAESAGGSLTVNPDTGLVEANFLKRMLPTLVGIGVGIGTGNPFLGAAAGAAVGGVQAKENKQDVGMGMLMGGLGGYGGAGLGAGLTAAGGTAAAAGAAGATTAGAGTAATGAGAAGAGTAASMTGDAAVAEAVQRQAAEQALAEQATQETIAQNAAAESQRQATREMITGYNPNAVTPEMSYAAQPPSMATEYGLNTGIAQPELTTAQRFSQAGDGIGQLATKEGRAAFGSEFGMMEAGAGAAPLMAPGKAPGEAPVDDEMYEYDYDVGRTGAERTASDSSAERTYFDGRYSPMRRVRAGQYGYAEGGITGDSDAAMSYLMEENDASQAGLSYLMSQTDKSPVMQGAAARQTANSTFVAPTRAKSTIGDTSGYAQIAEGPYKGLYQSDAPKYAFDPTAQKYYRSDDVFEYVAPPEPVYYNYYDGGSSAAQGGLIGLAQGGMASGGFVVPADVVSALGNGSTDAGLRSLKAMLGGVKPIKGKGDGLSDSIKTDIDGKQPARVADGEAYIDPKTVKRVGGAKKLYAMMDKVRAQAHGKTSQQRKVNPAKVLA